MNLKKRKEQPRIQISLYIYPIQIFLINCHMQRKLVKLQLVATQDLIVRSYPIWFPSMTVTQTIIPDTPDHSFNYNGESDLDLRCAHHCKTC